MVRFGSPDLRTGALGVKRVRGTVSPYSRGRAGPKKAHFGQNSKFDPRSTFRGDLFLRRSILKEGGVLASKGGAAPGAGLADPRLRRAPGTPRGPASSWASGGPRTLAVRGVGGAGLPPCSLASPPGGLVGGSPLLSIFVRVLEGTASAEYYWVNHEVAG